MFVILGLHADLLRAHEALTQSASLIESQELLVKKQDKQIGTWSCIVYDILPHKNSNGNSKIYLHLRMNALEVYLLSLLFWQHFVFCHQLESKKNSNSSLYYFDLHICLITTYIYSCINRRMRSLGEKEFLCQQRARKTNFLQSYSYCSWTCRIENKKHCTEE